MIRRTKQDLGDKPTRHYSNKQETKVAKELGIRKTKNSGATAFDKGDVSSNNILFEMKTKVKESDSISVKKEWFDKNKEEARFMGKEHSVVVINFGGESKNYYILEEDTFKMVFNDLDVK